jgi:hypothetical protein
MIGRILDFLSVHPIVTMLLLSGICLLSSRQDEANGHRGGAIFWQVVSVFVLVCFIAASIIWRMWLLCVVGLLVLGFEAWLAKRWWGCWWRE